MHNGKLSSGENKSKQRFPFFSLFQCFHCLAWKVLYFLVTLSNPHDFGENFVDFCVVLSNTVSNKTQETIMSIHFLKKYFYWQCFKPMPYELIISFLYLWYYNILTSFLSSLSSFQAFSHYPNCSLSNSWTHFQLLVVYMYKYIVILSTLILGCQL